MENLKDSLIFVKSTDLLIEAEKKWFDQKFKNDSEQFEPVKSLEQINSLRDYARKLYEQDIVNYNAYREKTRRSDHSWIKTVMKTGTSNDKMSANCILIQDSAVHNLNSLEALIGSVKLSKKRECMLAIDALKDLFINYLLPKKALKSFHEHPFEILTKTTDKNDRNKRLILWYFESLLKISYNNFIKAIQTVYKDTLATTKFKVTTTLFDLITANPYEQLRVILETIVNKLGDPEYKVASRIIYDIKNYLAKCSKMKMDVLVEIERLVSRQNINQRAQYYGFCCMNQYVLKRTDTEVANRLLLIYFSFFKKFIKTKEIDSRMLGALLTGVNRAYKFAKMDNDEIDKNLNTLFKLVHVTSFNVSMQALMLLNQVIDSRDDMIHRYYNALYKKMFDLEWRNTSKQTFFLNLLFNSIKKDEALPRIKAFVKRLLQICFSQNVPFICGTFMLISELMKLKPNLFQFDSSLLSINHIADNDLEKFKNDEEEEFKDVKSDDDENNKDEEKTDNVNAKDTNGSWIHKKNIVFKKHYKYDYQERNPLYCGADKTLTFELLAFTRHYHPTVVVFANKLLNNEPVEYTGDPMEDFTLIHFLDRFVYKNPKKTKNNNKSDKKSIFEPVKSIYKSSIKNLAVNSKDYLNLDPKSIPAEEKFFYDYYKSQQIKKSFDIDSEAESVSDSEFDAYLAKTEVDGADGNDDWALDFADEISKKNKNKKKSKEQVEEDDDDFENDDEEIVDEFEDDEEFENSMIDADDDEEEENNEFENDENFDEEIGMIKMGKKKRGKEDISSLFAAADEFTDMINESSRYDEMGVGSISNKDNAGPKQLKWEMKRNDAEFKKNKRFNNKKIKKFDKSSKKKPFQNKKKAMRRK